ncbi:hypothetical protein [Neorhizobium alkalisoli]|uniref:ElaB/YqjD/DUF883 family membrane-anchored ribosome-binding protein n=1 Tax=Neorhizobium alkalisoli TaxID=528178 RepID=A0A561PZ11_9HYPH|nr:hypothetical protein [Neorhizobium alkalisoli]TWF43334.1 hypothetical protein FHW37_1214 [Neorhizobium alkalisoli]
MARDLSLDIDRLTEQLSEFKSLFTKQAATSKDEAYSFFAPRARQAARLVKHDSYGIANAARRNPTAATGAIIGALAIGTLIGFALSAANRKAD